MERRDIWMTDFDLERLRKLLEGTRVWSSRDREHLEQLDEERAVVADGVPEILRRSLATLTRAGDAVRGPVLLDELGMLDRDVGGPLLEVVDRVPTVPHHPLNEIVGF